MTGQGETSLKRVRRGRAQRAPSLKGIEDYVREVGGKVGQTPQAAVAGTALDPAGSSVAASIQTVMAFEETDASY